MFDPFGTVNNYGNGVNISGTGSVKGGCVAAGKTYSPTDQWPRHTSTRFNDLYDVARSYGWTLTEQLNHGNSLLKCPSDECTEIIYSTGKGGESFAISAQRKVRRCPHNQKITSGLAVANALMEQAGRLLDATELCITSKHAVGEVFQRVDDGSDDADIEALLEGTAKLEQEAAEALTDEYRGSDAETVMAGAENKVAEVRDEVATMDRGNPKVREAWNRYKTLRTRSEDLRKKLDCILS